MKRFLAYFVVFLLGFIICAWVIQVRFGSPIVWGPQSAVNAPRLGLTLGNKGGNQVRDAAKIVSGYVVNIDTIGRPQVQSGPGDMFGFPFGEQQEVVPKGQASGVVFNPNGYIITNNHVVAGAAKLTVTLKDGKRYPATLVGRDPKTDIAVIKIDAHTPNYAVPSKSSTLQVGDWVIAVGSPLGLESTVTVGVVSATRRGPITIGNEVLSEVIQTDAAINPGNSGGALADLNGNLVGINTAIASTSGGSIGIGFAIPSDTAMRVVNELVKHGKVVHPWLGVRYAPYNDELRKALQQRGVRGLPKEDGAIVAEVYEGSPAAEAGLQPQDIILKVNGKSVSGTGKSEAGKVSVADEINDAKVGSVVKMEVWHASNGRTGTVGVRVGEMPADFGEQQ